MPRWQRWPSPSPPRPSPPRATAAATSTDSSRASWRMLSGPAPPTAGTRTRWQQAVSIVWQPIWPRRPPWPRADPPSTPTRAGRWTMPWRAYCAASPARPARLPSLPRPPVGRRQLPEMSPRASSGTWSRPTASILRAPLPPLTAGCPSAPVTAPAPAPARPLTSMSWSKHLGASCLQPSIDHLEAGPRPSAAPRHRQRPGRCRRRRLVLAALELWRRTHRSGHQPHRTTRLLLLRRRSLHRIHHQGRARQASRPPWLPDGGEPSLLSFVGEDSFIF